MVTRQITLAVLLLLALCAPAYAEVVLYDVTTVTYQVIEQDFPPYFTAGASRWSSSGQVGLVDNGPQQDGMPRWMTGDVFLWEAFSPDCPVCVVAQPADPRGLAEFLWLGGAKDPFASFYLTQSSIQPHYSIITESFTVGVRVSPKGPRK